MITIVKKKEREGNKQMRNNNVNANSLGCHLHNPRA